MNYLKTGSAMAVVWSAAVLVLLVFHPGVSAVNLPAYSEMLTLALLIGLVPAGLFGALVS